MHHHQSSIQNKYYWQTEGKDEDMEIIVDGRQNIWIMEMGRKEEFGSFSAFVDSISSSNLKFGRNSVKYASPSQGHLEFGWNGHLKQNGEKLNLKKYPRYENPYCETPFGAKNIRIKYLDKELNLDFNKTSVV